MNENNNYYVDPARMLAELEKWRDSDPDPDKRHPSEELGRMLMRIHVGVLRHANFRNYRQDVKDEMMSYSIWRVLKNGLKTFKFDGSNPFSYFTRGAFLNYYTVLNRYYNALNRHQEYVKDCLARLGEAGCAQVEQFRARFRTSGQRKRRRLRENNKAEGGPGNNYAARNGGGEEIT